MTAASPLAVVDYGSGNTGSLTKALDHLGAAWRLAGSAAELDAAERIVFPGVGAFGAVMQRLEQRGLVEPLRRVAAQGRPLLAICVGLQVLFERSAESPGAAGLAVFSGSCERYAKGKVPQIGWNEVRSARPGLLPDGHYYFVNGFYPAPLDPAIVLATADYHGEFVAAVAQGSVTATQFHPEKSGALGLRLLRNWLDAG